MPLFIARKVCAGIAACAALLPAIVSAATCTARSGPGRAALVELYTSEGCNSCPPADRWLSGFPANGFGRERVVPLAFHVDYWDYIGWKDRFASPGYTERQRRAAVRDRSGIVYTPQVMVNGTDLRVWGSSRFAERVAEIGRAAPGAQIGLRLRDGEGGALEISAHATLTGAAGPGAVLYLALYENGLSTQVKAGENGGRTLRHDYVVRELIGPLAIEGRGLDTLRTIVPGSDWLQRNLGVAAFVQELQSGEVLQAVALPVCG